MTGDRRASLLWHHPNKARRGHDLSEKKEKEKPKTCTKQDISFWLLLKEHKNMPFHYKCLFPSQHWESQFLFFFTVQVKMIHFNVCIFKAFRACLMNIILYPTKMFRQF